MNFRVCHFRKGVSFPVLLLLCSQCAFTLLARAEMSGHTGGTETRSLHRVLGNILEFGVKNYTAPWERYHQHGT